MVLHPIRTFEVVPFLPHSLERLQELAYNLRWTWDHETIELFVRLDPKLWDETGHNPVLMLGTIRQERLNEVANDEGFVAHCNRIYDKFSEYMKAENTWCEKHFSKVSNNVIAYFSAEFGLSEALPIYSGGLGVLAGDHLKGASDLNLPLVGVGLVYQQGYFRQYLNQDGWQQQLYPMNDFYNMPIVPCLNVDGEPILISVDFPGRQVHARIWKAQVGRVPLFLLDTNVKQNSREDVDITSVLYNGDAERRIQQEILLGIGGMRALQALNIVPTVCHMNEGHSAFLALERIRMLIEQYKIGFSEARELAATGHIFTTHTAVPAGIDKFSVDLIERYLGDYYRALELEQPAFLALGRENPDDSNEPFSMANLAISLSSQVNGVSKLHGYVSRHLFKGMWKDVPEDEVPISHITNGIHAKSWISNDLSDLFDRYLGPKWSENGDDEAIWRRVDDIPDEELWRAHERRRERLVALVRHRLRMQQEMRGASPVELRAAMEVFDPTVLTIGFARRVATYKRALLLFRNPERLVAILNNRERPVQIIIAGKAHPEDTPAKEMIRQIFHFTRREDVRRRCVFIEDYDMNIARYFVQGVDVWLNTPRRYLEACGTSGMKVAFNGGINVSILDGWWDEAYNPRAGWTIGRGEVYENSEYQDQIESAALYDLLEKEIIPTFYSRREPSSRAWINKMKSSMAEICPVYNVNRMVKEYALKTYLPASRRFVEFAEQQAAKAKTLAQWKKKLHDGWGSVKIEDVQATTNDKIQVNDDMQVTARISLGELKPEDVCVQIFHGPLNVRGGIIGGEVAPMKMLADSNSGTKTFTGVVRYLRSGRHGLTVRVIPNPHDLFSPFETGLIHWAN